MGSPPSRARAADWRSRSERRDRGLHRRGPPGSTSIGSFLLVALTRRCDAVGAPRSARRGLRGRRDTVSAARSARRGRRGEFGRVDATRSARSARSARRVCVAARLARSARPVGAAGYLRGRWPRSARPVKISSQTRWARRDAAEACGSRRPRREVAADVPCSELRAWSRLGKRSRSGKCSQQRERIAGDVASWVELR